MDNIGDILSSLSDKDIESLKQTAQSLFGGTEEKKEEPQQGFDFSAIDPVMIGKITRMMSAFNSPASNPRSDLIRALKPLLKSDKQLRADQALQMMKMLEILPLLKSLNE